MSKNLNISVLVAARDEYIEQLKSIMCPLIIQGISSIYQDAIKIKEGKGGVIYQFQQFLNAMKPLINNTTNNTDTSSNNRMRTITTNPNGGYTTSG